MFSKNDQTFMQQALNLAQKAESHQEVPIGAVLVYNDEIIAEGFNQPIGLNDPTAHAEIIALRHAAAKLKNYRLVNTTLYVTLEPCAMCAAAMVHARIQRLVFGAKDAKTGAVCSVFNLIDNPQLNHKIEWQAGLFAEESAKRLQDFFKQRR